MVYIILICYDWICSCCLYQNILSAQVLYEEEFLSYHGIDRTQVFKCGREDGQCLISMKILQIYVYVMFTFMTLLRIKASTSPRSESDAVESFIQIENNKVSMLSLRVLVVYDALNCNGDIEITKGLSGKSNHDLQCCRWLLNGMVCLFLW